MKNRTWNYSLLFAIFGLILAIGCKKDDNSPSNTIKDIDGNMYDTVTIGTQVWMVENLKTTKFNDGTPIPLITDPISWAELTTPGYCWWNNDAATYKETYGGLYNWYTVNTGKLCPKGWHVPSNEEWTILREYLGGRDVAGGKLKEAGFDHFMKPNTGATNETGFTALPGGLIDHWAVFDLITNTGIWWSTYEQDAQIAIFWSVNFYDSSLKTLEGNKKYGLSVRCIKD